MKDTAKTDRQQAQERALSFKEQRLTYREVAAEMGITEGAAQYLVRSARLRLAKSLILAERLRVHPDWLVIEPRIDAKGVGAVWLYWRSIPDEVVWVDAYGTEITATEDGYLVEAPYVEYSYDAMIPFSSLSRERKHLLGMRSTILQRRHSLRIFP